MAVYATVDDVTATIGADFLVAIADHDRDGTADVAVIERALAEASSLAETYLSAVLPLSEPYPPVLVAAVVDIALQRIRAARDRTTNDSTFSYKAAIEWLRAVQAGEAELGTSPDDTSVVEPGDPLVASTDQLFSRRLTRGLL